MNTSLRFRPSSTTDLIHNRGSTYSHCLFLISELKKDKKQVDPRLRINHSGSKLRHFIIILTSK